MSLRDPQIYEGRCREGQTPRLACRIQDHGGTDLMQADVSSIAYAIYDTSDNSGLDSGTLLKADVVYDTLQNDDAWTEDANGFNFAWVCDYDNSADAGKTLQIEVVLTLTSADTVPLIFHLEVEDVLSLP